MGKKAQVIVKNTVVLTLADGISRILFLVLAVYIARNLGVLEYGKYSFAFVFTFLSVIFCDLGLYVITIREVARDKTKAGSYIGTVSLLKAFLSIFTFSVVFVFINIADYPSDTKTAVYLMSFYGIVTSFTNVFHSIFNAFERMEYQAIINLFERSMIVTLGVIALSRGYGLIEIVSIFVTAGFVSLSLGFIFTTKKFARPKFEMDLKFWKYLVREALPLGMALVFITVYLRADIVILSMIRGNVEVGFYNAANSLVSNLVFIPTAFMASFFPVMSEFFKSSRDSLKLAYEKSLKFLLLLAIPVTIGTVFLSDRIILFLYREEFSSSIIVLQMLAWVFLFTSMNTCIFTVLNSMNMQRTVASITFIGMIFNIILNLLLISIFGYIGAGITAMTTSLLIFIVNFYIISKHLIRLQIHKLIVKPLIASLLMGTFVSSYKEINLLIVILLGGILYLVGLLLLRTFTKDEFTIIKKMIGH